jgi:hypothetical protein
MLAQVGRGLGRIELELHRASVYIQYAYVKLLAKTKPR